MKVCLAAVQAEHMGYLRHLTPWLESKGHEVREQMSSDKYDGLGEADVFIVWNGTEMVGKPDGKVLYAEVGWFPGAPMPGSAENMYLDREGINAASELFDWSGEQASGEDRLRALLPLLGADPSRLMEGDYTFVPLQMDDDSNVRLHGRGWTARKLIKRCLQTVEGPLVFKRHPRDTKDYDVGRGVLVTSGDIWDWILPAKQVIGINSTALFQAWAAGKEVLAYGNTFWAQHRDRAMLVVEVIGHRQIPFDRTAQALYRNTVAQEVFCET